MKKVLCIILSALLIGALCLVPASAAEASLSYVIHRGNNLNEHDLSAIRSLPTVQFPLDHDGSSGGQNVYFVEFSLPSFVSLNSIQLDLSGNFVGSPTQSVFLYDSEGSYMSSVSVPSDHVVDLSQYSDLSLVIYAFSLSSGRSATGLSAVLDYESPSVWNGISDFIGGLFGAVGSILGGALNNTLLLMFLILIPLSGIVRDILYYNFLNKRKKSNSINRYRAKRGNYGRDSYKEV